MLRRPCALAVATLLLSTLAGGTHAFSSACTGDETVPDFTIQDNTYLDGDQPETYLAEQAWEDAWKFLEPQLEAYLAGCTLQKSPQKEAACYNEVEQQEEEVVQATYGFVFQLEWGCTDNQTLLMDCNVKTVNNIQEDSWGRPPQWACTLQPEEN